METALQTQNPADQLWAILNKVATRQEESDRDIVEMKQANTGWRKEVAERQEKADREIGEIRQMFRESAERQKETDRQMQETDRRMQETDRRMQETDRQMQETDRRLKETERLIKENGHQMQETDRRLKETERLIKENGRQIGGLSNRFGELAEHLVGPGMLRRFAEIGFHYDNFAEKRLVLFDDDGNYLLEIDIYLENDDTIMAVEVKAKPNSDGNYIGEHVKRLELLRDYRIRSGKRHKRIMGAIAGAVFQPSEKRATVKAGLFVIEQSGDTMRIDVPAGFVPREW